MKRYLFVIAMFLTLVFTNTVFAKSSPWAAGNIEKAVSLNIIPEDMALKSKENITRLEFCYMAVNFYRLFTGNSEITLAGSPFFDINDPAVNKCYELGIISGIEKNLFGANGYITREQMSGLLISTLKACGSEIDYKSALPNTGFADSGQIDPSCLDDTRVLASEGVLSGYNGYFYPKSYVTIEQLAASFIKAYEVFKSYGINVGGEYIEIGDSIESVLKRFGDPGMTSENIYGLKRYVYTKDPEKFLIVSFKDDRIAEMFSNAPSLVYKNTSAKENINSFSEFTSKATENYSEIKIKNYNMETRLFFDYSEGYRLDAVYIKDTRVTRPATSYNVMIAPYTEKELLEIINVYRYKHGLKPFGYSPDAYKSAKNYSVYMRENESFEYIDLGGLSPFDRMKNAGIKYGTAAENIAYMTGDSINIYHYFVSSPAMKSNMLMPSLDSAGIGCTILGNRIYTVLDMFGK